jgi:hypothetical protein
MQSMGYSHYWQREKEIEEGTLLRIAADFQQILLPLDDLGVRLAGPYGSDIPEINSDGIAFNGIAECGHPKNEEIYIPFPSETATGIGNSVTAVVKSYGYGVEIRHRTCDGLCRCEPFVLERRINELRTQSEDGSYFACCKTHFKPYDLAVQCILLICKHHLQDRIDVTPGGSDFHWNEARLLCYQHLNYPLREFAVIHGSGLVKA